MATSRSLGRPKKKVAELTRDAILAEALVLIDGDGGASASFRTLADRFGVTPMAVSYHVGSRRQMLADVIDIAFRGVADPPEGGTPAARIKCLLVRYCGRALAHAGVIRCILRDPSLMSRDLHRFTDLVRQETQSLNAGDARDEMLNLIVDYTHGFVFSAAVAPAGTAQGIDDFVRSLDWILAKAGAHATEASVT